MKKLLYISYCAPYDSVRHAGGKTHNFYLKEIAKNNDIDLTLLTFVMKDEIDKIDLDNYGIKNELIYYPRTLIEKIFSKIINVESKLNPFNRNGSFVSNYEVIKMKEKLNKLKNEGYNPEIILIEWTQILFNLPVIKEYFPEAKVFSIEVDVAFLGKERESLNQKGLAGLIKRRKASVVKKLEMDYLNMVDYVFTNNEKDKQILVRNNLRTPVDILTPYFDEYSGCKYSPNTKDIVFFGAMDRPENNLSALWFINNVLPKLSNEFRYVVVGNRPTKELQELANDRILVTGFVEDVKPYFEKSLCFVSNLVLGAGIKVKVIEAMSSGIPVICNDISIEGIDCVNNEEFILCHSPEDYVSAIERVSDLLEAKKIGEKGKEYIYKHFNYKSDCVKLQDKILEN